MPNTASRTHPASGIAPLGELASRLSFARLLNQDGRLLQLHTALPTGALIPEVAVMREAVNEPFELVVDALSTSRHFELKALLGEQATLLRLMPDGRYAPWHGHVTAAAQLGADGGLARWQLTIRPWISLLGLRRDCFAYQDKTAADILRDLFNDHPQASYELHLNEPLRQRSLCIQYRETDLAFMQRLLAEEGLSYHFKHLEGETADAADRAGQARHVLVITDRLAPRERLGELRFAQQHATANLRQQRDAVTAFAARRTLAPNAVTLGSWNYKHLAGTAGEAASRLAQGEVPPLELYDGAGAYRYESPEHADRAAHLALAALELGVKQFEGQGSARHLTPGAEFTLVDHPLYGANTTAQDYLGALEASRQRPDHDFVVLAVEHHAANNLGGALVGDITPLLRISTLEHGSYKNHFLAAPAAAAVVPLFRPKPTAPGLQTALVVGVPGSPLTTDRDLRVKLQFPWQRGTAPLPGGLNHDARSADAQGNAPGNDQSLTWVRIALPSAGAHWGSALVPRVGTEVAVQFIEGDIDRPMILGQLHNGRDLPPFSAGEGSDANHPGVLSGLHSQALDGSGFNQWVVDDSTGQLRMRLLASTTTAHLSLGHLIHQDPASARRGAWRGSGFEAGTTGWLTLRAAQGLLLTTAARPGTYGSAQSTQMDAAEAVALLNKARALGQALSQAAQSSTAQPLTSHAAGQAMERFVHAVDVQAEGRHPATPSGQPALQAGRDGRSPGEPVPAFQTPVVLLHTPSTAALITETSAASFSGQDTSLVAHADLHLAAGHTYTSVSGQTTSLYTHDGGAQAIAANGPLSLRAHTDSLQLWADQAVSLVSVNDEIHISAQTRIELSAGQSGVVLEDGNVSFICPGKFEVKAAMHGFLGGGRQAAVLSDLPVGTVDELDNWLDLSLQGWMAQPLTQIPYTVTLSDGSTRRGVLDGSGQAHLVAVPPGGPHRVEYANPPTSDDPPPFTLEDLEQAIRSWVGA